jgi:hypothetical protein
VTLLSYGAGGLLLQNLTSLPSFFTFGSTLAATILLCISTAIKSSSLVWLYDHEGKGGMKDAHGLQHLIIVVFLPVGFIIQVSEGSVLTEPIITTLSYLLIMVIGFYVLTFPDNYGNLC